MTETQEPLPGILAEIVRRKRVELEGLSSRSRELERQAATAPPCRPFARALRRPDRLSLVAECKRRSPGAGPIRPALDPAKLAVSYQAAGAACLSVLTDRHFFGGSPADLIAARSSTRLPVLRKDFVTDPLDLLEARAMGADAVLLIVRILGSRQLGLLYREAVALGMDALVEVHDRRELEEALELGAELVGVNNRDLATFATRLDTTLDLLEEVPDDVTLVSESGIRSVGDAQALAGAGVDAVLVGEALLRSENPRALAGGLASVARRERRSPSTRDVGRPGFKVCGVQRRSDALLADRLGASYVGVIASAGYSRSIDPARARRMTSGIRARKVAVLVDEPVDEALARARETGAELLQLHGQEDPETLARLKAAGWTLWKGVRADSVAACREAVASYAEHVSGFVVEGRIRGVAGGGGAELALRPADVKKTLPPDATFVLAGGLDPVNLADKVAAFRPDAVDVSSGIESEPGAKDAGLLRAFASELAPWREDGR